MPNVMAALPNIGGALCESSVIPLLVLRRKVWLTPAAGVPCSNAAIYENARLARSKILSAVKSPRKCIHSVAAQQTPKHRAKFGLPPMNDVASVTKARRETR